MMNAKKWSESLLRAKYWLWRGNAPFCPLATGLFVCRLRKSDHVSLALRRLHWLPMPQWVSYKLCLMTYKDLHAEAPPYIAELCRLVTDNESRRRLRSVADGQLLVSRTRTDFGKKSFAVAGPTAWNSLPTDLTLYRQKPSRSLLGLKPTFYRAAFGLSWLLLNLCVFT